MSKKMIAIRLDQKYVDRLVELSERTGWTQTEVIRRLIERADIKPAEMSLSAPKSAALAVSPN